MIACEPPLDPIGYTGCAASPISVTRPRPHDGSGSRSTIGYSRISGDRDISPGTSSQSKVQSLKYGSAPADHDPRPPVDQRRLVPPGGDRVGHELDRRGAAGDGEGGAGQERPALGGAAPHHHAAPPRRRLVRGQLGADGRVEAVRADEDIGGSGDDATVRTIRERYLDAAVTVREAGHR